MEIIGLYTEYERKLILVFLVILCGLGRIERLFQTTVTRDGDVLEVASAAVNIPTGRIDLTFARSCIDIKNIPKLTFNESYRGTP
jgi:hypothetical protein